MSETKECHSGNYPAKHYQSTKEQVNKYLALIEDNPLATLIFHTDTGIEISHIPCHFTEKNNTRLMAHVSNNHPLAKKLQQSTSVAINLVFHGGDAYISPNDVSSDNRQAQMVPTWNYAKVHIAGTAVEIKADDEKYNHMEQTSDYFEYRERSPLAWQDSNNYWALGDAPKTAIKHMLNAITVFTVQVDDIDGRFKLSQNKSPQVKEQLAKQLSQRGTAELGQLMLAL